MQNTRTVYTDMEPMTHEWSYLEIQQCESNEDTDPQDIKADVGIYMWSLMVNNTFLASLTVGDI